MNRRSVLCVLFGLLLTPWRLFAKPLERATPRVRESAVRRVKWVALGLSGIFWTESPGELCKWSGGTLTKWANPFADPVVLHNQPEPLHVRFIMERFPHSRTDVEGFPKTWDLKGRFPWL